MIRIQKDPRIIKKHFKCIVCDCEFTADYDDTENFAFSRIVHCPVCEKSMEWPYGEDILINNGIIVEEHNNE